MCVWCVCVRACAYMLYIYNIYIYINRFKQTLYSTMNDDISNNSPAVPNSIYDPNRSVNSAILLVSISFLNSDKVTGFYDKRKENQT